MCGSKLSPEQEAELRRTREIDKRNMEDEQSEARKIKLLLLGTRFGARPPLASCPALPHPAAHDAGSGESGKSTIFKQMKVCPRPAAFVAQAACVRLTRGGCRFCTVWGSRRRTAAARRL